MADSKRPDAAVPPIGAGQTPPPVPPPSEHVANAKGPQPIGPSRAGVDRAGTDPAICKAPPLATPEVPEPAGEPTPRVHVDPAAERAELAAPPPPAPAPDPAIQAPPLPSDPGGLSEAEMISLLNPQPRAPSSRDGLRDGEIAALVSACHGDPFALLGLHALPDGPLVLRALLPQAERVWVLDAASGAVERELDRVHGQGLFSGQLKRWSPFRYRLRLEAAGRRWEIEDPYRFWPVLGELDLHLIGEGQHWRLYEKLGAHPGEQDGIAGTAFAVWAPNARRVSVVGDFNDWDGRRHQMRRHPGSGVWDIFLPGVDRGALYKFEILGQDGRLLPLKADPLAYFAEQAPGTASIVHGLVEHAWGDQDWMARRADRHALGAPVSIYEVHAGSWMRVPEEGGRWLTWAELADLLVPYVSRLGFTHVEFLPVSEHPFDGSWGYQPIGLFAPTSRFGSPADFAHLVDRLHQAGIGVILDWVPGHFPTDAHGLAWFDGTALYEHADPRQGFHQDWQTLIYNFGRNEVRNFLIASALIWLDRFHIDGLRVDAVASMLYLDYSRQPGEWIPNQYGGNENLEAITFLRQLNERAYGEFPGIVTIAEESTAWPAVSRPIHLGGLGFGYKWNMGWMHDTLRYVGKEPIHRRWHHHDLTFGLLYAFSENFVLPLSHDEVVHGKGSLIGRLPGDDWQRFATLRAYFGFMWTHPGKKLLFMGGEFAQWAEWSHARSLDWHLTEQPLHQGVSRLVAALNRLYRGTPALHAHDCDGSGFEWIDSSNVEDSVLVWLRKAPLPGDPEGGDRVVVTANWTPVVRHHYRIGVPRPGRWRLVLNTDEAGFGGAGVSPPMVLEAEPTPWHGRPASLAFDLPPLATLAFRHDY